MAGEDVCVEFFGCQFLRLKVLLEGLGGKLAHFEGCNEAIMRPVVHMFAPLIPLAY